MFPPPNSDKYILKGRVAKCAGFMAKHLEAIYHSLHAKADKGIWKSITSNNISLTYETTTGITKTGVWFKDHNGYNHTICLEAVPALEFGDINEVDKCFCKYLFEGNFNSEEPVRSFAGFVMLKLWEKDIEAELSPCGSQLKIQVKEDKIEQVLWAAIRAVTANLKEEKWFHSTEIVWGFIDTNRWLQQVLPLLKEEASKDRWFGVKPEHFKIKKGSDECFIILEQEVKGWYKLFFRIGRDEYFHLDTPYQLDINCVFELTAKDEVLCNYLYEQNRKFLSSHYNSLPYIFSYNSCLYQWDNGFQIGTKRKYGFQKYCLMLDIMIPLMDFYEAPFPPHTQQFLQENKVLEQFLSSPDFEVVEDSTPYYLYREGKWV